MSEAEQPMVDVDKLQRANEVMQEVLGQSLEFASAVNERFDEVEARIVLLEVVVANSPFANTNVQQRVQHTNQGRPITADEAALLNEFSPGLVPSPPPSTAPEERVVPASEGRDMRSGNKMQFYRVILPDGLGTFSVAFTKDGLPDTVALHTPGGVVKYGPRGEE